MKSVIKPEDYNMLPNKVDIPIKLYTSTYDVECNLFKRLVLNLRDDITQDDIIHMGLLIRYKEQAGRILGVSFNFHFKNETTNEITTTEFYILDSLNVTPLEMFKYQSFVEIKLKDMNFDFKYTIKHKDIREK